MTTFGKPVPGIREDPRVNESPVFLEDDNVQKSVGIGAAAAIGVGVVYGPLEFSLYGLSYPVSLSCSFLAIVIGCACHILQKRDRPRLAVWTLIWGVWFLCMYGATFQDGLSTPLVLVLPVLIMLVLWVTGNKRNTILMLLLSLVTLTGGEVSFLFGIIDREGMSSPFGSMIVAAVILTVGCYITLHLFDTYMARYQSQLRLAGELKLVTDTNPVMFTVIDRGGEYRYVNKTFASFYGYLPEELIGMSSAQIEGGDDVGKYRDWLTGESGRGQFRSHRVDSQGAMHWLDVNVTDRVESDHGSIQVMLRDVTERVNAEQALVDSEHKYRAIVDTSVDPFYQGDLNGDIVTISPSIEKFTGFTAEDLIGNKLSAFYAVPEQREEFLALLQANGEVRDFEAELVCKDGSTVWVSTHAHYWKDGAGDVLGVEGIIRDITQWREVQTRLARAQKVEVLDQLTIGMAHDFNNLLGIILGGTELVKFRSEDNEELTQLAGVIEQAARRANELTNKMVAFTELDSAETMALDVNESLIDLEPLLRSSLTSEISFEFDLDEDLWLADSFAGEFQDAIINLAVNARDEMSGGGELKIITRNATLGESVQSTNPDFRPGDYVRIDVVDTGKGIPAAIQEKVFEPFFTTKSRDLGTGLGLSMVYGFVRRSSGDVTIRSAEGHGTRISIYLPRSHEIRQSERRKPILQMDELPQGRGERILLVEDEPALAELNQIRLESLGYEVSLASNGVKARAYLETDASVDLVLTDVVMPGGITGIDLVEIARALRPSIKLLVCSGLTDTDELMSSAIGLPDVLRKPFTTEQMADAVRSVLDD